jgi:N-acetylmuramoyl-L-alanine amidase
MDSRAAFFMKGEKSLEQMLRYMTQNDCYRQGRALAPGGIMIHATASPGVMAADWYERWNKSGVAKCVHAFVDEQRTAQYLPWTMRGWHCGSGSKGSANNTHIGLEICEDKDWTREYFDKAWENAVELTAFLCLRFGLTQESVISHKEGHDLGIASNHGDPDHWWSKFGRTMNDFRARVAQVMDGQRKTQEKEREVMQWMKVTVSDYLNLREQPANTGKIIGKLLPGQLVRAGEDINGWRAIDKGWAYGGKGYLTAVEQITLALPVDLAQTLARALADLKF